MRTCVMNVCVCVCARVRVCVCVSPRLFVSIYRMRRRLMGLGVRRESPARGAKVAA